MNVMNEYQKRQLEAIQSFYSEMKSKSDETLSMTEAVIAWFTDGYAEEFRASYLKDQVVFSS